MKKNLLFIFLVQLLSFSAMAEENMKLKFFTGSLTDAQTQAAKQGKLYFVDFTASWCAPCRMMDEVTFTNPDLINYIEDNYVPVKVDIESFDGFEYKQQYNIRVLPSILVFDSKGKLLARYEQSMTASKLLATLKLHDSPQHRAKTSTTTTTEKPQVETKPAPLQPAKPQKGSAGVPSSPTVEDVLKAKEGLYRFKIWKQSYKGYSLQIGSFANMGNVLREVSALQEKFDSQPIIINVLKSPDGKDHTIKILIGVFETPKEAAAFQALLSRSGTSSVIRDLSSL